MVTLKRRVKRSALMDFILFCRDDKEGCCFCWRKSAGQVLNENFDADCNQHQPIKDIHASSPTIDDASTLKQSNKGEVGWER